VVRPFFYDVHAAKDAYMGKEGFVKTPINFRLLGIMHGHFNLPDAAPDAIAEDGREKIEINTGIAIVIPAEKIVEVLAMFADEEAEAAERYRNKMRSHVAPDS
jgi:hypothetical protein